MDRCYIAIDLKSFYASIECVERGLDPLDTNLVVADESRTEKTICLAVSPSLKSYGIPGRARLFEVVQKMSRVNAEREKAVGTFCAESYIASEIKKNPHLCVSYIVAPPRMATYIKYSMKIYDIYLKYFAPEDIHIYSIDEVFIDATAYLKSYKKNGRELTECIINDILAVTGITATAGIGTNLYLAKIAMDIGAKKIKPDANGVRIAELDEMTYRKQLWNHRPLTDFWRVGKGYAKKLEANGIYTMGDIARCSLGKPNMHHNEELLYKLFGVNAELLIDHAWGWEPCTISDIKSYKPDSTSRGVGQVLTRPYKFEEARMAVKETADILALELAEKGLMTNQIVLTLGYDIENLASGYKYNGEIKTDMYGRKIPKNAHGTQNMDAPTFSSKKISKACSQLFNRIADSGLLVRRFSISANNLTAESDIYEKNYEQMDLFTDYKALDEKRMKEKIADEKEKNMQKAVISMQKKYGKNAVLKGINLQEGATAIDKNRQIGGHKA